MHHLRLGIVSVLVASATAVATAESPHTIRLTRPVKVGHAFHLKSNCSTDIATTVTTDGRKENAGTIKLTAIFDAVGSVMKIDDAGRAISIAYTVNECTMKRHGHTSTIVPKGATLIARQGKTQTRFFVKKTRFSEFEQLALETLAGMNAYLATKDEMFGSTSPRSVGEQWPINSMAVAAEFQRYTPQKVVPDNIDGTTALLELIDFEGQQCQVVRTQFNSRGALPGFEQMPPGTRLKSVNMKATTYDLLPVDMQQPLRADGARVEMDIVFSGSMRGRALEGHVKGVVEYEHTFSPITRARAAVEP